MAVVRRTQEPRHAVLAHSWRRSEQSGLDPGSPVREGRFEDVDPDSRLIRAARPVIDELAQLLDGSSFSLLLADRDACIVARRFNQTKVGRALDAVLAVPGATYGEDVAGTNALSTAYEIGRALSVVGDEHFLEALKGFSCFAHPIVHPVTGVLEGVLDITGLAGEADALMAALIVRAGRDIEDRLALGSNTSHQRLLSALQSRSRGRRPVLVFGRDLVLANDAADLAVDEQVRRHLRLLCAGLASGDDATLRVDLPETPGWTALCSQVAGVPHAVLCEIDVGVSAGRVPRGQNAHQQPTQGFATHRDEGSSVLFHGERGTGRTRAAMDLAGPGGCTVVPASAVRQVEERLSRIRPGDRHLVVIEDISVLDDAGADRLARTIDATASWVAMTSLPLGELTTAQRALAARCPAQVELAALRARRLDLGEIARDSLRRLGLTVRLTPGTVKVLERHDWPGNVRELETVLAAAARRCAGDVILPDDLPAQIRLADDHPRTPLQQAERDAILACLLRHRWNKAQTASELGIGRNTLYRMMRNLDIRE